MGGNKKTAREDPIACITREVKDAADRLFQQDKILTTLPELKNNQTVDQNVTAILKKLELVEKFRTAIKCLLIRELKQGPKTHGAEHLDSQTG